MSLPNLVEPPKIIDMMTPLFQTLVLLSSPVNTNEPTELVIGKMITNANSCTTCLKYLWIPSLMQYQQLC